MPSNILCAPQDEEIRELYNQTKIDLEEKYKKDYVAALQKFRVERARFQAELNAISGIRVIPSQANYFMIELTGKITAKELTKKMLLVHDVLIKDLSTKVQGEYIRIAIRSTEDNNRLIEAFRAEIF